MTGARPKSLEITNVRTRVVSALRLGPLTVVQLVTRVGMTYSTVQRILNAEPELFEVKGKRIGKQMGMKWGLKN